MAQQYDQQRQRQRGRSQEYERDYSDEDLGVNDQGNYNELPNRNIYNPPGGGRGYGRGEYNQPNSAEGWGEQADPWRGLGYARGDYGQDYGRNRNEWREDSPREGINTMTRAREYPGQREYWEPLRNRSGDVPGPAWWLTPGPYMGKGPLGWSRSKERIMEDVCERMAQHGQLDATNVQVDVNNGQVTLSGQVNRRREKRIAEDIAESVWGVNDVINQIRVAEGMESEQRSVLDRDK